MPSLAQWIRPCRVAAWKAGLISDPTRAAARAIERVLDTRGKELFEASGVPGLVALVRFADGPEILRCYGTAGAGRPMRADTVFQVLSLSKAVTAMCALALVDRGVLALDEPVWNRIRSWRMPPHRSGGFPLDGITLRRLLSHSAGLNGVEQGFAEPGEAPTATDLLQREGDETRTLRVIAPPGATFRYAGGGFVLVQRLIEVAAGMPFSRVARELVLRPLGMDSSDFELLPALAARLATRHDRANEVLPQARLRATATSGLFSTAEDLATFYSALAPGRGGAPAGRGVICPASCTQMVTQQSAGEDGVAYGLGLHLRAKRSDLRAMHDGYYPGWYGHAEGYLRRRVVIMLLSNGSRGGMCVPPLTREIRRAIYDLAL